MSSMDDLYERLRENVQQNNNIEITKQDSLEAWISDVNGNTVKEWDLTDILNKEGLALVNYTNKTLDIDMNILFLSNDVKKALENDKIFLDLYPFFSSDLDFNITVTGSKVIINHWSIYATMGYFSLLLLLGVLRLIANRKSNSRTAPIVKFTRSCACVWNITTSILLLLSTIPDMKVMKKQDQLIVNVIRCLSMSLVRVFIGSNKIFTAILYVFNCIMLFRPFIFRRYVKKLSRYIITAAATQYVICVGVSATSCLLIIDGIRSCMKAKQAAWVLNIFVISLTIFGFIASSILGALFTVKYFRTGKNRTKTQSRELKLAMIKGTTEILFDIGVLVFSIVNVARASFGVYHYCSLLDLTGVMGLDLIERHFSSNALDCDIFTRINMVDAGLSNCGIIILIGQNILQDSLVIFESIRSHYNETSEKTGKST